MGRRCPPRVPKVVDGRRWAPPGFKGRRWSSMVVDGLSLCTRFLMTCTVGIIVYPDGVSFVSVPATYHNLTYAVRTFNNIPQTDLSEKDSRAPGRGPLVIVGLRRRRPSVRYRLDKNIQTNRYRDLLLRPAYGRTGW